MATQLGAVTGKRIKPNYSAQIEGRIPNLLAEYQAKEDKAYRDEVLASDQKYNDQTLALQRDALENQKKQTQTANTINTGSLLLSAYLGLESNKNLASILGGDVAKEAAKGGGQEMIKSAASSGFPSLSDLGSKITGSPYKMAGSVAIGQMAGSSVGSLLPFGGEAEKEIIGSGLAAGAAGYLLTGDPYSAAMSGLTSAGLSSISHW